jgi:REP element-mobilizing transposase RayT
MHAPGSTLFLTFRLVGTVPKTVLARWKAERELLEKEIAKTLRYAKTSELSSAQKLRFVQFNRQWFKRFEDILHAESSGPIWLKEPKVAEIVAEALHHRDGKEFRLNAFCIMSNHVHAVFRPLLNGRSLTEVTGSSPLRIESAEPPMDAIMRSLKRHTARQANLWLGREGKFWETESYDHEVRDDDEFASIVEYTLNNPVKAGLVDDWREWEWSWHKSHAPRTGSE